MLMPFFIINAASFILFFLLLHDFFMNLYCVHYHEAPAPPPPPPNQPFKICSGAYYLETQMHLSHQKHYQCWSQPLPIHPSSWKFCHRKFLLENKMAFIFCAAQIVII